MNKISEAFENKKAFIPFITGGDPSLDVTKKLILAMQEAGADLIEVGIPFSDPIAEGPVIQEADERALSAGCTLDKLFDAIKEVKDEIHIPMVFMTYVNPIFTYGKEKFMQRCVECGMAGVIVPDVPFVLYTGKLHFKVYKNRRLNRRKHVWKTCRTETTSLVLQDGDQTTQTR